VPVGPTKKKEMGIWGVRFFFFLQYFELDEQITLLKAAVFLYTKPTSL